MQGAHIEVARRIRRALLWENARVASRSHDVIVFRKVCAARAGGGCRAGTGGVGVCSTCVGGRTTHGGVCIGYKVACSLMLEGEVGVVVQERAGLVLVSNWVCNTHPVIPIPSLFPSLLLSSCLCCLK